MDGWDSLVAQGKVLIHVVGTGTTSILGSYDGIS